MILSNDKATVRPAGAIEFAKSLYAALRDGTATIQAAFNIATAAAVRAELAVLAAARERNMALRASQGAVPDDIESGKATYAASVAATRAEVEACISLVASNQPRLQLR